MAITPDVEFRKPSLTESPLWHVSVDAVAALLVAVPPALDAVLPALLVADLLDPHPAAIVKRAATAAVTTVGLRNGALLNIDVPLSDTSDVCQERQRYEAPISQRPTQRFVGVTIRRVHKVLRDVDYRALFRLNDPACSCR
jgi:hypothetical protein